MSFRKVSERRFLILVIFLLGTVLLLGFRGWRADRGAQKLVSKVEVGETWTDHLHIRNDGTTTNAINVSGTYTADIDLQSGDTIANTAAGTVTFSGAVALGDDLTCDSVTAGGDAFTGSYGAFAGGGDYATAATFDRSLAIVPSWYYQANAASIANPAGALDFGAAYFKSSAITADQTNTSLYGVKAVVDNDMATAAVKGVDISITRNGDKACADMRGLNVLIDLETGAAMTGDLYGAFIKTQGTNTGSGLVETLHLEAAHTTDNMLRVKNNASKTTTNMIYSDNDGTATGHILLQGAPSTYDIKFPNNDTLLNGAAGTLTTSASIVDAQAVNVRYVSPQQVAAVPAAPHACDAAHLGQLIYVDDNNDTAESFLCFCGIDADDSTHIWLKVEAPATDCF